MCRTTILLFNVYFLWNHFLEYRMLWFFHLLAGPSVMLWFFYLLTGLSEYCWWLSMMGAMVLALSDRIPSGPRLGRLRRWRTRPRQSASRWAAPRQAAPQRTYLRWPCSHVPIGTRTRRLHGEIQESHARGCSASGHGDHGGARCPGDRGAARWPRLTRRRSSLIASSGTCSHSSACILGANLVFALGRAHKWQVKLSCPVCLSLLVLSQRISEQYFQPWLISQANSAKLFFQFHLNSSICERRENSITTYEAEIIRWYPTRCYGNL
jgi:hypothetical protein